MANNPFRQSTQSTSYLFGDPNSNYRHDSIREVTASTDNPYRISSVDMNPVHIGTMLARMKRSKWRNSMLLLFLFFTSIVILTCFAYFHVKEDLDRTRKDVYALKFEVENMQQKKTINTQEVQGAKRNRLQNSNFRTEKPPIQKKSFVAINMIGADDQQQRPGAGVAVRNWETTLKVGNISNVRNSYIQIHVAGVYYIYAQMFFSENKSLKKDVLHFYIRKNRMSKLVVASVPHNACQTFCTRYISRIVKLKKHEDLSIATSESEITFNMSRDKAQFGAYLLKETV